MPNDLLASSWTKFHWAEKHLVSLDRTLNRSFNPNTHPVSVKTEVKVSGDAAVALVRVAHVYLVGTDCGLKLGDVLQNFRAALDHLAWDLVRAGATPRPPRPDQIYFPMLRNYASWKNRIDNMLPGVPDEQRAVIRRYQPYGRGPGAKAIRLLRNFSDGDKHRVMVPVTRNALPSLYFNARSTWRVRDVKPFVTRPTRLKVNTPLWRVELERPPSYTGYAGDCQVDVDGEFPVLPTLPRAQPMTVLGEIRNTVLEILTEFDARL